MINNLGRIKLKNIGKIFNPNILKESIPLVAKHVGIDNA